MILKDLKVELKEYGPDKGQYVGAARFMGESGEVAVKLNPKQTLRILDLCANAVVAEASKVAEAMVAPLIEQEPPQFLKDSK